MLSAAATVLRQCLGRAKFMLVARDVDADLRDFSARGGQRSELRARDADARGVRGVQTQCPYLSRVMSMLDLAGTMEYELENSKPFGRATQKFAATIIKSAATTVQTQATLRPKTQFNQIGDNYAMNRSRGFAGVCNGKSIAATRLSRMFVFPL